MTPEARPVLLVVDDDPRSRTLIRRLFEQTWEVEEAENGTAALARVASGPVDLILLDVVMPGPDGIEVCRTLRSRPSPDYLPILLLTSLSDPDHRTRGLEAGADDYLAKPLEYREVELRVGHFLRLRRQDQLIRRQVDELQRLGRLREDLTNLIVHDLQNPLSGLLAAHSLMTEKGDDKSSPKIPELLACAADAGRRLREGIEGILEVKRLEEAEIPAERSVQPLKPILRDALSTLKGAALLAGVSLREDCPDDAAAFADGRLLRRALENLVSNAVKHSPRGGTVAVRAVPGATGCAIEVEDEGPGVPDEFKEAVFSRFGSVEQRRGSFRRGYGLGLYLVKLVASVHGGSASVTDRKGGGAVFQLSLPTLP